MPARTTENKPPQASQGWEELRSNGYPVCSIRPPSTLLKIEASRPFSAARRQKIDCQPWFWEVFWSWRVFEPRSEEQFCMCGRWEVIGPSRVAHLAERRGVVMLPHETGSRARGGLKPPSRKGAERPPHYMRDEAVGIVH
jgi:hypothetical protein